MTVLFWISVFWITYVYMGYYVCLKILSLLKKVTFRHDESYEPFVSIIVAAFNEEKNIEERILNLLKLDYPKDKFEIMIGSDGSTDGTVKISQRYCDKGVVVLDFKDNRGRSTVHNECVAKAKGDVIVFTDAETVFENDFLGKVARNYADERVGSVVGSLSYISKNEYEKAEGFYFRFERSLRNMESKLGMLFSGTGACFSIRKKLYRELKPTEDIDFILPIDCIKEGYLVCIEPEAIAYDVPPGNVKGVYIARSRQVAKALSGILGVCGFAFWFRHPVVGWGIISHRIMKWLGGFLMAFAFVSNMFILNTGTVYVLTMAGQIFLYGLCLIGAVLRYFNKTFRLTDWVFIFVVANAGMSMGVLRAILGRIPSSYKTNDEDSLSG